MPAKVKVWNGAGWAGKGGVIPPTDTLTYDWSDTNVPWAYTSAATWEADLPVGAPPIVDLSATGATFWDRLNNTQAAQSGRFICRLGDGDFSLSSFRLAGSSGDPKYAFGFFFPKVAGFTSLNGPDHTSISMAANSMSSDQLTSLAAMKQADFLPNQMGLCRIDSTVAAPLFLGGITWRSDNQQNLTSTGDAFSPAVTLPQPAPHQGVVLYGDGGTSGAGVISHCRFQGAGKAWMSQPPFEMANVTSSYGNFVWKNCEFDGRIAAVYDSARPRKCGPIMMNKEYSLNMFDCWGHHSNVSRFAANDQTFTTTGRTYSLTRCKFNQITNTHNDGNGGYTNATPIGFESTNALVTLTDCIITQDNSFTDGQIAQHVQFTSVSGSDPAGGRARIVRGTFRNPGFPILSGWLCMRIPNSHWKTDGYTTTIDVRDANNIRKTAYVYNGAWPPTQATLDAAGVAKETHYLIKEG